ncbi:phosphohistidine phosphatase SixA [Aetokthonos hydrillicola Thurmond2011]|jgi:phosphohistidine phosphatase|uniref:Phosphohistidine phosphatase SixA n=1 Tax=Aetokthonos hydrillicola Thurmond2011 TaxID=2712845 RepID=A0AAP5I562_9CYAN|nr:phosphohistidine phosphatase SixA [Aetokthonos hydrillicola]MBO3459132.1 phosphohistidine phosphatase SixA [Aetokthonos hydrillicola CCALA 1050]MBW4584694.1 phosphohistidine phosphatase SixA [Aetokthonos hydrillicola CCALA 1050]MDR9895238.1 phosphohistidine phosphatase SixA [Aetokthonos hydrillicola Thurmond2011]
MELYLIRHGIAEESAPGIKDEERALTKEGRQKTEKVAKELKKLNLSFDLIASSPLVRAYQTAEILIETGLSSHLEECLHLAPDGDIHSWIAQWLEPRKYSPETQLALVGHEPNLSSWAQMLVWGQAHAGIVLKKAGMIGIKLPEKVSPLGRSQMFWLTSPKYLL